MTNYELLKKITQSGYEAFEIKGNTLLYLLTLISFYDHKTKEVWPSRKTIKECCGMEDRTQLRAQDELIEKNLLYVFNKDIGDLKRHNSYKFNIEYIEQRLTEVEQSRAQAAIERYNTGKEKLFEPLQDELPIHAEECPFTEATETPQSDVLPLPTATPQPIEEKPTEGDLYASTALALAAAYAFVGGSPTELQISQWKQNITEQNYIYVNNMGDKRRFYFKE